MEAKRKSSNLLCIAAHPDDEVLGCGGALASLSRAGHSVYIAIMGEGATSRNVKTIDVESLANCSKKASKILGIKKLFMMRFPDNKFDTVPLLNIVKEVESVIDEAKPELVFTHHYSDLNIDHRIVHRAVLTVCRPTVQSSVKDLYMFEIPSATDWSFNQFGNFKPNVFYSMDDEVWDLKIRALKEYHSELRDFPFPRSLEYVESMAIQWGGMMGYEKAEAFELIYSRH